MWINIIPSMLVKERRLFGACRYILHIASLLDFDKTSVVYVFLLPCCRFKIHRDLCKLFNMPR